MYVEQLKRKLKRDVIIKDPDNPTTKKVTCSTGKSFIVGSTGLKQSEMYPVEFCRTVAELYTKNNTDPTEDKFFGHDFNDFIARLDWRDAGLHDITDAFGWRSNQTKIIETVARLHEKHQPFDYYYDL